MNSYTYTQTPMVLNGTTWSINPDPYIDYVLTPGGWMANPRSGSVINNGDGTLTVTPTYGPSSVQTITSTDLAATGLPECFTASGVACTNPYPAGSAAYTFFGTRASDEYRLFGGTNANPPQPATDLNGVPLTALPGVTTSFCVPNFGMGMPITGGIIYQPSVTGAGNYNTFTAASCAATDITAAMAVPQIGMGGSIQISSLTTGNTSVPQVLVIQLPVIFMAAGTPSQFFALRAGRVYPGVLSPKGNSGLPMQMFLNKTANNAILTAQGYPPLP